MLPCAYKPAAQVRKPYTYGIPASCHYQGEDGCHGFTQPQCSAISGEPSAVAALILISAGQSARHAAVWVIPPRPCLADPGRRGRQEARRRGAREARGRLRLRRAVQRPGRRVGGRNTRAVAASQRHQRVGGAA
jgi:hypothetical protein